MKKQRIEVWILALYDKNILDKKSGFNTHIIATLPTVDSDSTHRRLKGGIFTAML